MLSLLLLAGFLANGFSQQYPMVNQSDIDMMRGYFTANIGPSAPDSDGRKPYTGCVIASPSQVDPTYYYHWQRDASVSMNVLRYTANDTSFDVPFQNYIQWVTKVQSDNDPNGINVLGEPKFYVDGTVYDQGWCRPQNDGPATRSLALNLYAQWLIANGNSDKVQSYGLYIPASKMSSSYTKDMFKRRLQDDCNVANQSKIDCGYVGIDEDECVNDNHCCWLEIDNNPNNYPWCFYPSALTPTMEPTPHGSVPSGLIPIDLNYVNSVWQSGANNNCDLWEEERGPGFYTYMVQYQALVQGAVLAKNYGDDTQAQTWSNTADAVCKQAQTFDNNGFISETYRDYDCSVILGPLYGGDENCFPPTNEDVMNTAGQIAEQFDSYFQVNQDDDNLGIPGVLLGRYTGDSYPGCNNNGGSQGHAWILCSNALGDLYYRNGDSLFSIYNKLLNNEINELELNKLLNSKHFEAYALNCKKDFKEISDKLYSIAKDWKLNKLDLKSKMEAILLAGKVMVASGDGQLTRVKYHTESCNMHLTEQICENSGEEIGAYDLTWSYGTMLSAWYYRSSALKYGYKPIEFKYNKQNKKNFIKHNFNDQPQCESGCTGAGGLSTATCCDGQCN